MTTTEQPIRRALWPAFGMPGWTVTIQDGTGDVFPLTYWVPTVAEALAAVQREAAEFRRTYPNHPAEGTFTVLNIEAR